ncbi:MAG: ROK family protein [Bythopirellula sp.]|nr:ROK family protein [Bythopirellula sp.]
MKTASLEKQAFDGRNPSIRIGVDLGGSDVKLGATNLSAEQILTPELVKCASLSQEGPQKTISQIIGGIQAVLAKVGSAWSDVADIAVTVPCPCSSDGLILNVPNLGTPETKHLWQVPFGDLLAAEVEKTAGRAIPVFACNDANAAGQDEDFTRFGHSTAPRTTVFATTGTGLGGCIVINGKVFFGLGQAGELGHMKIAPPAAYSARFAADPFPICGCGAKQCAESRASLSGLIRRITWALSDEGAAVIRQDLESRGQSIDPEVFASLQSLHKEGAKRAAYEVRTFADQRQDAFCRWLLDDWAIMFGAMFASVATVLHPDLFIIGGGLTEMSAEAKDWFLATVKESYATVNKQGCFDSASGNCDIQWSVSRDQGWRGAILMAMRAKA